MDKGTTLIGLIGLGGIIAYLQYKYQIFSSLFKTNLSNQSKSQNEKQSLLPTSVVLFENPEYLQAFSGSGMNQSSKGQPQTFNVSSGFNYPSNSISKNPILPNPPVIIYNPPLSSPIKQPINPIGGKII